MQEGEPARVGVDFIEEFCRATIATLRSGRLRRLLAQMPKAKVKKQKSGAKRSASRGFFGRRKDLDLAAGFAPDSRGAGGGGAA